MFVLLPRFQQKLRITQKMAANNDFIKDITISKMQWKLKVRVVRMWEKPDRFNPGSIFSIELVLQDEKVFLLCYWLANSFLLFEI